MSKTYRVVLSNDYGSEEDAQALADRFPGLEGQDLEVAAFEAIHDVWHGLTMVRELDFGGIFTADQPPPESLPRWVWVSEVSEQTD
jgi:hypothetical protein